MRAIKCNLIGILTVLAIVGCGKDASEKGLTHEEVRAINERVLEKAISSPDSALMLISSLRDDEQTIHWSA